VEEAARGYVPHFEDAFQAPVEWADPAEVRALPPALVM
jgi:hypothetical protein